MKCSNQNTQIGWIYTKTRLLYMLPTRDMPETYGHIQLKVRELEKDIPCKQKSKKAGVAILISDKTDF